MAEAGFEGNATELLAALEAEAGEESAKAKAWPKTPSALSGALRRLAPNLRAVGVNVDFDRTGHKRLIRVGTGVENAVTSVMSVTPEPERGLSLEVGDDGDDGDFPTDSNGRTRLQLQREAVSDARRAELERDAEERQRRDAELDWS